MKNLARHIDFLLRDNDCVILPGFGGFIAHDVPAYYVSEEGLYYPPSRNISFNAAITMNDGLLTQSYMKSYQVDYARANHMIDMAVEQLTDRLDEEGSVTLPHIGTIKQDVHQSLQFIPDAAGIASPMHFGLGSLVIKELTQLNKPAETQCKSESHNTDIRKEKIISLHINKEVLHRVMSTAAILLLLLMVALPTGTHRPTDIASLHLTQLITDPQTVKTEALPVSIDTEIIAEKIDTTAAVAIPPIGSEMAVEVEGETITTESATAESTMSEPIAIVPSTTMPVETENSSEELPQPTVIEVQRPTKTYHIIVASLPSHRGANEELNRYADLGYSSATLVERDDRVRISLAQFADKDEANAFLTTLRQSEKFQNAWLLAVRN